VTAWLAKLVIDIFGWAFSVDLLNGAHGALAPIGNATQALYANVIGASFMTAAVLLCGIWAIWKGLAQRRFSEALTGIGVSVLLVAVALLLIQKPVETIGMASKDVNQLSTVLLSAGTTAATGDTTNPLQKSQDHLFQTFVYDPWVVLEFGGLKHCVAASKDSDGFPNPVAPTSTDRVTCRDHLQEHGGFGGYAPRFLQFAPSSAERDVMYKSMNEGVQPKDPCKNPDGKAQGNPETGAVTSPGQLCDPKFMAGWKVDKADAPAVDIQQAGGAYQRFVLAVLLFIGVLGAVLLLGMLAFAALIYQVIALLLLAFAPIMLLAGLFPGAGHRVFRAWLGKLATALFIKLIYSLLLAVLIGVSMALVSSIGSVSYLMAFGLQAAFFWTVFLKRHALTAMMSHRDQSRIERTATRSVTSPLATAGGLVGGAWLERKVESHRDKESERTQEHAKPPASANPATVQTKEPTMQNDQSAGRREFATDVADAREQKQNGTAPALDPKQASPKVMNGAEPPREFAAAFAAAKTNGSSSAPTDGPERQSVWTRPPDVGSAPAPAVPRHWAVTDEPVPPPPPNLPPERAPQVDTERYLPGQPTTITVRPQPAPERPTRP
jgi:hypothetical protein